MLAKRIIPTILSKNGQLVKGEGFAADRVVGNALQAARIYAMRGVDELMVLDVTATQENREPDYESIRRLADGCFSPLTVGGGVRSKEHIRELLRSGADKVCIGKAAADPEFIEDMAAMYGSSTITVSVDYNHPHISDVWDQVSEAEASGAGEILLQSVDRDGTMVGYDIELIEFVSHTTTLPIVVSGGCSGYEDMYNAIQAGADAVAAGALFQFTAATPKGAAEYLHSKGVEVRL